jgi:hypothetical protein
VVWRRWEETGTVVEGGADRAGITFARRACDVDTARVGNAPEGVERTLQTASRWTAAGSSGASGGNVLLAFGIE